jgi:nucleoside triphosphate pyrophosphatase
MALWLDPQRLVLASRSAARRNMMEAAGIPVDVVVADIDERAIEARSGLTGAGEAAVVLAQEKARAVGVVRPERMVVGADQTLVFGQQRLHKPVDRAAARRQLAALAGHVHELHSAVAVVREERVVFSHVETARLTMRPLSDVIIERYLDAAGPDATASVGAYQLEKLGVHLFERIEGDHFTILGLPLLPLLAFLRREGSLV